MVIKLQWGFNSNGKMGFVIVWCNGILNKITKKRNIHTGISSYERFIIVRCTREIIKGYRIWIKGVEENYNKGMEGIQYHIMFCSISRGHWLVQ